MIRRLLVLRALGAMGLVAGPAAALTLSVASPSADPGQKEVAVTISADNAKGIAGGDLTLSYPAAVLTAKQVKAADLVSGAGITLIPNLNTAGQVKVSMAGAAGISSGSGALVQVTFEVKAGAAAGTYELGLKATLRDENGAVLPATLKNGTLTIKAAATSAPQLKVSVTTLSFDSTKVGASSQKTLTVSNPGKATLTISKIALAGTDAAHFKVSPTTATVAAGGTRTLTLTFAPTTAGAKSASLSLTHNATGSPTTITLKGVGVAAATSGPQLKVSVTTLSFDSTKVGVSSQKTLTVSNTGKATLTISKIALAGTDAAHFKVSPTTATVAAGGTRTLTLTFAPTTAGAKSASLSLTHNATGSPTTITLKGVGMAPPAGLQLAVGTGTGSPGGTVAIPISASNAQGIAGGDLTLSYPAAVLTAKQVKAADLVSGAGITLIPNLNAPGQVKVSMAGAAGISSGAGALVTVTFEVKAGAAAGTYELGLKATLRDENGAALPATLKNGAITIRAASSGKPLALPAHAALWPNYPNPFNASTVLRYALAEAGPVQLAIYSAAGTQVRLLVSQPQGPGVYEVVWDGHDEQGHPAASGLYLGHLEAGGMHQTQKLLLLK